MSVANLPPLQEAPRLCLIEALSLTANSSASPPMSLSSVPPPNSHPRHQCRSEGRRASEAARRGHAMMCREPRPHPGPVDDDAPRPPPRGSPRPARAPIPKALHPPDCPQRLARTGPSAQVASRAEGVARGFLSMGKRLPCEASRWGWWGWWGRRSRWSRRG